MSSSIAETSSGGNIWPVSMPANAISASKNGSGYTFYFESDLYSASIPPILGTNVNAANKTVAANALGVSDGGSAPSLNSGISRSFDRHVCWNDIERAAKNGTGKYDYITAGQGTTQGVVYAVINNINYKF